MHSKYLLSKWVDDGRKEEKERSRGQRRVGGTKGRAGEGEKGFMFCCRVEELCVFSRCCPMSHS